MVIIHKSYVLITIKLYSVIASKRRRRFRSVFVFRSAVRSRPKIELETSAEITKMQITALYIYIGIIYRRYLRQIPGDVPACDAVPITQVHGRLIGAENVISRRSIRRNRERSPNANFVRAERKNSNANDYWPTDGVPTGCLTCAHVDRGYNILFFVLHTLYQTVYCRERFHFPLHH